jgi:hypothetical protein
VHQIGEVLPGGLVLLGPVGSAYAKRAVEVAIDAQRRNGLPPPPGLRELAELLATAVTPTADRIGSAAGTTEPLLIAAPASSSVPYGWADTAEVMAVTGWSNSYATRACRSGRLETARQVGGRWFVERAELDEWRQGRQEARSA